MRCLSATYRKTIHSFRITRWAETISHGSIIWIKATTGFRQAQGSRSVRRRCQSHIRTDIPFTEWMSQVVSLTHIRILSIPPAKLLASWCASTQRLVIHRAASYWQTRWCVVHPHGMPKTNWHTSGSRARHERATRGLCIADIKARPTFSFWMGMWNP